MAWSNSEICWLKSTCGLAARFSTKASMPNNSPSGTPARIWAASDANESINDDTWKPLAAGLDWQSDRQSRQPHLSVLYVYLSVLLKRSQGSLAMTLTTLVYSSFGLSRLVGLCLDGMPSNNLVMATVVELAVAAIGLSILFRQPVVRSHLSAN